MLLLLCSLFIIYKMTDVNITIQPRFEMKVEDNKYKFYDITTKEEIPLRDLFLKSPTTSSFTPS
jgi:hypothetical protein